MMKGIVNFWNDDILSMSQNTKEALLNDLFAYLDRYELICPNYKGVIDSIKKYMTTTEGEYDTSYIHNMWGDYKDICMTTDNIADRINCIQSYGNKFMEEMPVKIPTETDMVVTYAQKIYNNYKDTAKFIVLQEKIKSKNELN